MSLLIAFLAVFCFSINDVFLLNAVFPLFLLVQFRNRAQLRIIPLACCISFLALATFATVYFLVIKAGKFEFRNFLQLLFSFQYLFLCLNLNREVVKKIEEKLVYCGEALAVFILLAFFYTGTVYNVTNLFDSKTRMWGAEIFPAWPNGLPLGMIYTLFLQLERRRQTFYMLLNLAAIFLVTSRVGIFGALSIIIYFWIREFRTVKADLIFCGAILASCGFLFLERFEAFFTVFKTNFTRFYDRAELFQVATALISERPLLGYGGNSADQLFPTANSSHFHNWVLEIGFRYGLPALLLFSIFLYSLFRTLSASNDRFFFIVLILAALFQLYVRNFVFIFFLILLLNRNKFYNYKTNTGG